MKSFFTFLTVLLLFGAVSAQTSLSSSQGYFPTEAYSIQPCNASNGNLGAAGENKTVNLANLQTNGNATSTALTNPEGTSFASSFPNASVASQVVSTQNEEGYSYYQVTAEKMELLGIGTSSYVLHYSNPMTVMPFPMNYKDSIGDVFQAQYTLDSFEVHRGGTVSVVADAWGNITTPAGTFPYLRLKTYQYTLDTFYKMGVNRGVTLTETFTYNYMGTNSKAPLYSYSQVYASGDFSQSAYYAINIFSTGTAESSTALLESASVFPNPASSHVNVNFALKQSSDVSILIVDITGKEVAAMEYLGLKAGKHQYPVNIETLPTGMYSAIIKTDGAQQQMRFIVE